MTTRKNAVTRFRLWLRTFAKSGTTRRKRDRVHYVRPNLESLEDRMLLSASPVAATEGAASVIAQWGQMIQTIQQDVFAAWNTIGQEIAQDVYLIQQQLDSLLGINPNAQNQPLPTPAPQSGSDWGSGSGSGSSSTASPGDPTPANGGIKVKPMDSNGAPGDRYEWDPGVGYNVIYGSGGGGGSGSATHIVTPNDGLASNPGNWLKNDQEQTIHVWLNESPTVPGNEAGDTAELGSSYAGLAGQQPIEWNGNFTFSTLSLTGYTAQETIDAGDTLELTGANNTGTSLTEDDNSNYVLKLDPNSKLTLDGGATFGNFNITGDSSALVFIKSGTTNMAGSNSKGTPYSESLGVPLTINGGAILDYQSNNTLNLTANNVVITVKGEMDAFWGTGTGLVLIQQGAGVSGSYIDVTGGTLYYKGNTGVEDTIAVPIKVENNGNFTVTSSSGGWLTVKGQNTQTMKYSVYMTSGSVNLSNSTTLECDDDYRQDAGTLQTTDSTLCALQDGATGNLSTAVINGGSLIVNGGASSGQFNVTASNLNFAGTLKVGIQGDQSGQNGLLDVSGSMNLQGNNVLTVPINLNAGGQLQNGKWTIIDTGGGNIAQFAANTLAAGLTGLPNQPDKGDYLITSP